MYEIPPVSDFLQLNAAGSFTGRIFLESYGLYKDYDLEKYIFGGELDEEQD